MLLFDTYRNDMCRNPALDVLPRPIVKLLLRNLNVVFDRCRPLMTSKEVSVSDVCRQPTVKETHGLRASAITALFVGTNSVILALVSANILLISNSRAYEKNIDADDSIVNKSASVGFKLVWGVYSGSTVPAMGICSS